MQAMHRSNNDVRTAKQATSFGLGSTDLADASKRGYVADPDTFYKYFVYAASMNNGAI